MKKSIITILLLCVVMLLCSCNPKATYTVSPSAQKYKYYTFQGTDWGMTKEECMKALGVSEKDLKPLNQKYKESNENDIQISGFSIKKNVYDSKANISCIFMTSEKVKMYDIGLIQIYVDYEDGCSNEKIYNQMCKEYNLKKPGEFEPEIIFNYLNEEYQCDSDFESMDNKEVSSKGQKYDNMIPNDIMSHTNVKFSYIKLISKPNEDTTIYYRGLQAAILHSLL